MWEKFVCLTCLYKFPLRFSQILGDGLGASLEGKYVGTERLVTSLKLFDSLRVS